MHKSNNSNRKNQFDHANHIYIYINQEIRVLSFNPTGLIKYKFQIIFKQDCSNITYLEIKNYLGKKIEEAYLHSNPLIYNLLGVVSN